MSAAKHMQEEEFSGKLRWAAWRQIAAIFRRRWRWVTAFLCSAGTLALIDSVMPATMGVLFNKISDGEPLSSVLFFAGLYGAEALCLATAVFSLIYCGGRVSPTVARDIREAGFAKLQELPFSYYDTRSVGWLMARLTSDCEKVSDTALWFSCDMLWGSCTVLFSTLMMMILDWRLALVVFALVPVLVLVTRWFQVRLLHASRDVSRTNSVITAGHTENINGVRTTKALAHENENLARFTSNNERMCSAAIRHGTLAAMYMPIVWATSGLGTAVILGLAGKLVLLERMPLGEMVAFMSYAGLLVMPVLEVARQLAELQRAQAATERIGSLLDTKPEIRDSDAVLQRIRDHASEAKPDDGLAEDGLPGSITEIEFRNVDFSYVDGESVLRDFNLRVRAGETIALVGPTGGGKTTIVQLMCRFYEPTGGHVLIDGMDYRERSLNWLQSNLGFVLQEPQLFSGTIAGNIRYGKLSASDKEVRRAAEIVRADEFIEAEGKGYDTSVGEGGVLLSAGQKQLISFARAVLSDPKIFVMDEATSAVDSETERRIQEGLEHLLGGRISFVIAHRLSTIRNADRIVFIDQGRIVEEGTHEELLRRRGRYYRLYVSQFQRMTIESGAG